MIREIAHWIYVSPLSLTFQTTPNLIAMSQSIHILCLAVLFTSAMLINMRLLGFGAGGRSVTDVVEANAPWIWRALIGLVITGVVQTITEPVRQFVTPHYWIKMLLIVVVAVLTARFVSAARTNAAQYDSAITRPPSARVFAIVSSVLWITIITLGRLIGYVWPDYAG